jgi:hypothetical protein
MFHLSLIRLTIRKKNIGRLHFKLYDQKAEAHDGDCGPDPSQKPALFAACR